MFWELLIFLSHVTVQCDKEEIQIAGTGGEVCLYSS